MNLVLDSVRSIGYKRVFSKIVNLARERKAPLTRGIAEIQLAFAMVQHSLGEFWENTG